MVRRPPVSQAASAELHALIGGVDIYLLDQILRGRFDTRRHLLDAGSGDGRNLVYLLQRGRDCHAVDRDPAAVEGVRALAAQMAPHLPQENFRIGEIDRLSWDDASMDAVVCSAVLHFADDESHFGQMMDEMWRVLATGGLFFARLASNIGLETEVGSARRRVRLPDGSERFVVDEPMLLEWTARLGGRLADPIKTTIVQQQRAMTTWVLLK